MERFDFGTKMFEPFKMKPGETKEVIVEMDYEGRDIERDFSVVAWGHKG